MRLTTTKFLGLALVLLATSAQAALINLTPAGTAGNSNTSVKLSDLLSGQVEGIKVGDKDFTGFSYSTIGDMPNAADVNVLGELLHGGEESLHGDSAYHSKELKARAEAAGIEFNVNERGTKHHPLTKAQRARNRLLSRIRATVEHPFLVVKRLWGHAKVRYRGIRKNLAQMHTLFGLANLYRVRYRVLLSP